MKAPTFYQGRENIPSSLVHDQTDYGRAGRNLQISDAVDQSVLQGKVSVFGTGFSEQLPSLCRRDFSATGQNVRDAFLVGKDAG